MTKPITQAFNLMGSGRTTQNRIYLDHNATTPLAAELIPYITSTLEQWGNPSSIHQTGRGPKTLVREAREKIAKYLNVSPLELVFTSGGSESNNLALKGFFEAQKMKWGLDVAAWPRRQIITTALEHPSVTKTIQYLAERGLVVSYVHVNREGQLDINHFNELLKTPTLLVSVMSANNEIGSIFPIRELCEMAHAAGALFHTDAVQTLGKMNINLKELGVDYASFSAHKFYALKGCGLLYVKKNSPLVSLIHGGGQERGRRAGTENTLAIASLGEMVKELSRVELMAKNMSELRDYFEAQTQSELRGVIVNAKKSMRLPNTSSLLIEGIDGESLLINLDIEGFSVSTGAACSSGNPEPSPTLLAIGLSRLEAQSSLRVSFGWSTTQEQVDLFVMKLKEVVLRLRNLRKEAL